MEMGYGTLYGAAGVLVKPVKPLPVGGDLRTYIRRAFPHILSSDILASIGSLYHATRMLIHSTLS
ncbi:hypothetical protein SAMN05216387_102368 [Nitrosovibrio tenuis]|uniref:Uncharacterized protein n=1 Tax=Nitrosovibrio tenuis TaxID=1233 RepID=A0A1H7J4D6_9PROT|nr:hypothetical protein SAMN05216387_102368 [Nitrosovibrio tenuis]